MRIGLDVSQHQLAWDEIRARACFAEDAGFESVWVFDHFTALYGDPRGPCLEGWSLLAALAVDTRRVRLGNLVTGVTYRHPSVLAAQAVTVDHLSGGRLEIGIGAAWHAPEHRALGIPFPATGVRARRLEEAVQVLRLLMTGTDASFEGRHYQLEHATYRPLPVQRPHPPIWIGASGEQLMLPIVGRQADAWHAFGRVEDLARKARIVDEHARRAGRDPAAILRSTSLSLSQPWDRVRATAETLRAAGFEHLVVSWPSEGRERLETFISRLLPDLLAL